jgi:hypothetical protein
LKQPQFLGVGTSFWLPYMSMLQQPRFLGVELAFWLPYVIIVAATSTWCWNWLSGCLWIFCGAT